MSPRVAPGHHRLLVDRAAVLDRPGEPDQAGVRPGQRRGRPGALAGGQQASPVGGRPSHTCSASMSAGPAARAIVRRYARRRVAGGDGVLAALAGQQRPARGRAW